MRKSELPPVTAENVKKLVDAGDFDALRILNHSLLLKHNGLVNKIINPMPCDEKIEPVEYFKGGFKDDVLELSKLFHKGDMIKKEVIKHSKRKEDESKGLEERLQMMDKKIQNLQKLLKETVFDVVDLERDSIETEPSRVLKKYTCHGCKKVGERKMLRCAGCRNVRYCSKVCQKEDFKEHKIKCKKVGDLEEEGDIN